jgi:hypothetical protein
MPPNTLKALVSAPDPRSSNGFTGDGMRVVFVLILALWSAPNVPAAELPAGTNSLFQNDSDVALVEEFNHSITSLSRVRLPNNFHPGVGESSGDFQYKLSVQPVTPVFPNTNLTPINRIILPFVHQQGVLEIGATETGLGDTTAGFYGSPTEPGPGGLIRFPNDS